MLGLQFGQQLSNTAWIILPSSVIWSYYAYPLGHSHGHEVSQPLLDNDALDKLAKFEVLENSSIKEGSRQTESLTGWETTFFTFDYIQAYTIIKVKF